MPFFRPPWGVYFRTAASFVTLAIVAAAVACSRDSEPTVIVAPPTQVPATTSVAQPTQVSTATPVALRTQVLPTATPEESGQTVGELLASIERGVEQIRGIDTPPPVEHMFVDRAGMRERLAEELNDPEVVELIAQESALLKLLGVIPQDSDLAAIY